MAFLWLRHPLFEVLEVRASLRPCQLAGCRKDTGKTGMPDAGWAGRGGSRTWRYRIQGCGTQGGGHGELNLSKCWVCAWSMVLPWGW